MANCGDKLIGQALAHQATLGKSVPTDALNKMSIEGQVAYARTEAKVNEAIAQSADPEASVSPEDAKDTSLKDKVKRLMGVPVRATYEFMKPSTVLGEWHRPLVDALAEHIKRNPEGDYKDFRKSVSPVISVLKKRVTDLPKDKQKFANDYLNSWQKGGTLYQGASSSLLHKMANNVLGGWAKLNPKISLGNILELDKTLAVYGLKDSAAAWGKVISETGGRPWTKIQRLEKEGLYNSAHNETGPLKIFPKILPELRQKANNVINNINMPSEVLLRNIAYLAGEASGKGGWHGVENIAFVQPYGNEPLIYHHGSGKDAIPLMRFSIEGQKFYYGTALNAVKQLRHGDVKPMANFLLYNIGVAAKGGAAAAIPSWVWFLIGKDNTQEWKDKINSLPGMNLLSKSTGTDVSQLANLSNAGITPGLQWAMLKSILEDNLGKQLGKAREDIVDGDLHTLSWRMMEILGDISQVTPYQAPLSAVKIIRALRKNAEETGEFIPSDSSVVGDAALKAIGAPKPEGD